MSDDFIDRIQAYLAPPAVPHTPPPIPDAASTTVACPAHDVPAGLAVAPLPTPSQPRASVHTER